MIKAHLNGGPRSGEILCLEQPDFYVLGVDPLSSSMAMGPLPQAAAAAAMTTRRGRYSVRYLRVQEKNRVEWMLVPYDLETLEFDWMGWDG